MFDDGQLVRAELSRPIEFSSGYFIEYSERIWILRPGEWEKIAIETSLAGGDEGSDQDLDINIRRK
ncbi:hypothetical protein C5688_10385 [Methylocystis sp. MitZ-2018]|nr:hypothetical protein C5688_10385 [Methylocystis sp. MitZ-2018]